MISARLSGTIQRKSAAIGVFLTREEPSRFNFNRLHVTTRQMAGSQSWERLIPGAEAPGGDTTQEKREE